MAARAVGVAGVVWTLLHKRMTIDTTHSIVIDADPSTVWEYVTDLEGHFEDSNPDHAGTWVLSAAKEPLRDGLRFRQRERVAGVTGELDAVVRDVEPTRRFTWHAEASYRLVGLRIRVAEEGTLRVDPVSETSSRLSHRVTGRFPDNPLGRVVGWIFVNVLDADLDAEEHTHRELRYFKRVIEAGSA